MNYLSVCSGIEAATVAWHDMGWNPLGFSEIEKFPSEVLKHHYPHVPNLGDMTKYKEWDFGTNKLDLLVGGTPCQSFSVAGLRKGLEDPRGNLAITYIGILDKFKPKWCVWENVPGVLSSNGGRDFGSFLGALVELGYGFAYRVLDAQYFGVAQRRRRVFVVGCLGDWESAAKVLFESKSLSRDTKKSRKKREKTANGLENIVGALCARDYKGLSADDVSGGKAIVQPIALDGNIIGRKPQDGGNGIGFTEGSPMYTLNATGVHGISYGFEPGIVKREGEPNRFVEEKTPTIRANMGDNQTAVAYAFKVRGGCEGGGKGYLGQDEKAFTLSTTQDQQIAFVDVYNHAIDGQIAATMTEACGGTNTSGPKIMQQMSVRRLTPMECERLQGFPDGYTDIRPKNKDTPDGPRYKALGNSMAVPVMRWIGERINQCK